MARQADRLAERVKALDEQGRKEVAARLPELLELPPETVAEPRTALGFVLGPVAQAPELIGF
ncbi:hypothetical protein [Nonomuraea sp. JJY05]|uniref:hypothetical protein n=1 Tax=Nonomuraea sp. JJY05 TaxID=3350255 RepID=UPI00373F489E